MAVCIACLTLLAPEPFANFCYNSRPLTCIIVIELMCFTVLIYVSPVTGVGGNHVSSQDVKASNLMNEDQNANWQRACEYNTICRLKKL